MPRPRLQRLVRFMPKVNYFKPAGIPMRNLKEIRLTVEELEAIRLKEAESMTQENASKKMNVSRVTFQRTLKSAHRKIAEALTKGKALRIEGGSFVLKTENNKNRLRGRMNG